jgi:spoIIIJ-associated protein
MEWVQTTGRTVDAALEAALDELGVHREDVEFEVIDEPKAGLFGRFGGNEARLRVRLKPISREKPQDRRRGRSKGSGGKGSGSRGTGGKASGGKGNGRRDDGPKRQKSANPPRPKQNEGATSVDDSNVSVEDQAEAAEEFVAGLVAAIGLSGDVTSSTDDDTIEIQVEGSELGLLVGPKAATLAAIEELTRAVVQREAGGHAARVRVDVGGYRAKRRVALEGFTRGIVDEVLSTGEARALEPMSSLDRKTVHDTVNDIDGVETVSEGEDARRHVVIRPT